MKSVSVLQCAYLSQDVYLKKSNCLDQGFLNDDWQCFNFDSNALQQPKFSNPFFARFYFQKNNQGQVIAAAISFRGTELNHLDNLASDEAMALLHHFPKHFNDAKGFYLQAHNYLINQKINIPIHMTGHSLGGALAQLVAVDMHPNHPQLKAIVFNSPGIGELPNIDETVMYPFIYNYNAREGKINKVGKTIGKLTELDIEPGDKLVHRIGLIEKTIGIIEQHRMANMIACLEKKPEIAGLEV